MIPGDPFYYFNKNYGFHVKRGWGGEERVPKVRQDIMSFMNNLLKILTKCSHTFSHQNTSTINKKIISKNSSHRYITSINLSAKKINFTSD
jgi:transcriptional regulator CtsR